MNKSHTQRVGTTFCHGRCQPQQLQTGSGNDCGSCAEAFVPTGERISSPSWGLKLEMNDESRNAEYYWRRLAQLTAVTRVTIDSHSSNLWQLSQSSLCENMSLSVITQLTTVIIRLEPEHVTVSSHHTYTIFVPWCYLGTVPNTPGVMLTTRQRPSQ